MFLGAVSTLRERQSSARSSSGAGTTSGDGGVSFTKIEGYEDEDLPRLKKSEFRLEKKGPLLFVSDENVPTRETIMSFFHVCTELMLDEEWLEYIIRQSETAGKPLQFAAMDFQRNVMENNFQIEANFGCTYLSKLPVLFQSDDELIAAAKRFMFTCLRSFIEAVKLRSRRFKVLRSSGGFSKISMLEFFEGCNAKSKCNHSRENKQKLRGCEWHATTVHLFIDKYHTHSNPSLSSFPTSGDARNEGVPPLSLLKNWPSSWPRSDSASAPVVGALRSDRRLRRKYAQHAQL